METKSLTQKLKHLTAPSVNENIGTTQRVLSVVGGAYILWSALASIASKKKTGVVAPLWNVVSGGYLVYRGVTGHCAIKESFKSSENKIISYLHKN
ncbi:MAG: hypothetical protein K0R51_1366 [Cytophagaceae bacterium]|nr:hypothetical protein [Cytophagaceae bacterium]